MTPESPSSPDLPRRRYPLVLLGLFGVLNVFAADTFAKYGDPWPATEDMSMLFLAGPLMCLFGGGLAAFELFQGAKKGIEANKKK